MEKRFVIWVWPVGTQQILNEAPLNWDCSEKEQNNVRDFCKMKGFNCRFMLKQEETAESLANMFRQVAR